jgi:hypothetical protein
MVSPKYSQVATGIKFMPVHEGIWGAVEVKLRIILKLVTVWRPLVSSTHLPLSTRRNNSRSPLNGRRLGGPHSRSVRFGIVKTSCLHCESNCDLSYQLCLEINHIRTITLTREMVIDAHFALTSSYCWILLTRYKSCTLCRIIALFGHSLLI